ncbi:MAG TPA: hypothetical protein VFB49_02775 [Patescibacteria group bacterium]|nr:hypothetical protein [Patescibacteria group bacterium]
MRWLVLGGSIVLAALATVAPWRSRPPAAPQAGPSVAAPAAGSPVPPSAAGATAATGDTGAVTSAGRRVEVPAGGDLQAALDRARPGDVIALQAGAVYEGNFSLPRNPGGGWVVLRTSAADADLPPPGTRIDPGHASLLPKLQAPSGAVLETSPGATHYRLVGLEIRPSPGRFLQNLVLLGGLEATPGRQPRDLIIDRCYVHGDPAVGARRGIALNSRSTAIIDSWLSDFKQAGEEAQAIAGWDGQGPFTIAGNYLEAAGENVIFGGSTPSRSGLVPSDIVIRDNHFSKPMSWKPGDPSYAGTPWTVKNLLELKNARRVRIEHNLMENNWVQAQNGFAVLFTVRTERGSAPWAVVEDVVFTGNVLRHAAAGINILGVDDSAPAAGGRTSNLAIRQNLFLGIGAADLGGSGILFQVLNGAAGVTIDHNTAFHSGSVLSADLAPSTGLVFTNNIVQHNAYGMFGSGHGTGLPALEYYFPGYLVRRNVIVGAPDPRLYPLDNFFPATALVVGFVDLAGGDYRLADQSAYHGAGTDGADAGADTSLLAPIAGPAGSGGDTRRGGAHD